MAENEINVINHLLEIESQATTLIDDAQVESKRRTMAAKAKADEIFSAKYRDLVETLEKEYNEKNQQYQTEHNNEIESYKNKILQANQDVNAFNAFLDNILKA